MLIAQAMGEYGGLTSLASTISTLIYRAQDTVAGFGTKEWAVVGAVCVVVVIFFGRRR